MENETVIIHGDKWKLVDIIDEIEFCRKQNWVSRVWTSSMAYGKTVTHDHCSICWWTLGNSNKVEENTGYFNGKRLWLCSECYEKFIR